MPQTYLVRGARQLLTLRGPSEARRGSALAELSIISDGAVLVCNGRILEIGLSRRVENLTAARRAEVIDATGKVVMPAFVDSGVSLIHSPADIDRGDQRLRDGCSQTARGQREDILEATRALQSMSKKGLMVRAAQFAESLARHGTATVGAVTGYGLDEPGEVKALRAMEALKNLPVHLVPIFFGGNAVPYGAQADAYARTVLAPLSELVSRRGLSGIAAVRCGPESYDVESARPFLLAARENGMRRAIYANQFAADHSARLAVDVDALSITHLEQLDDHGVYLLARANTVAVLTPAATFHMGLSRFAPARSLIDQGAAVALATAANPDQCPGFSMPFTIVLACRYLGMSVAEAITATTMNAAVALGQGSTTGSLEAGKQADILVLNARDYRELALSPGLNLVSTMMKSGRIIHGPPPC